MTAVNDDRPVVFRPGEAGRLIGVQPSTLRIYAQRFGELLGSDAAGTERVGYRFYTQTDIDLLCRARELLARGFTYERTISELRSSQEEEAAMDRRRKTSRSTETVSSHRSSSGNDLSAQLAVLEQAVNAWRALAEERGAELAALRDENRQLRGESSTSRRTGGSARIR